MSVSKHRNVDTSNVSNPIWDLLPLEMVIKIANNFDCYSQLRILRSLHRQTQRVTTPLHERCIRLRDQEQAIYNENKARIDRLRTPALKKLTCECGFVNDCVAGQPANAFECGNFLCKKTLLPTPAPPIIQRSIPGASNTPASICMNANPNENKFGFGLTLGHRSSKRDVSSTTFGGWKKFKNIHRADHIHRRSGLDARKLYRFSFCTISCCNPNSHKLDDCLANKRCVVSKWSEPSIEVHPLTADECSVLDGEQGTGYFFK